MLKRKFSTMKLAFVDIESTGLDPFQHEIIEFGCIIYDQDKNKIIDEWEKKIAPKRIETASREALDINGYSKNPKLYKGDLKTALLKFNKMVDGCILVGQNIGFDVSFIESAMSYFKIQPNYDNYRKLDLMSMAWPAVYNKDIEGLSLKSFCNYFKISNAGAHAALIDCRRSLGVYRCLMETYRTNQL